MTKLVILGTSTNCPDADHENTHMVLVGESRMVLIDGPANPYTRLMHAELDVNRLTDIIVTHFHPDHAAGIPLLLMAFGLSGRTEPMRIFANQHCMENLHHLLEAFSWDRWHDFPVELITIPEEEMVVLIDAPEFRIFSSPVKHFIPAVGMRVEFPQTGKVLAYSGDTAPTPPLVGLAENADVLIHEAAGASIGHSSAKQAGELAAQCNVQALYLIHYPVGDFDYHSLVQEAATEYDGLIVIAEDFDVLEF
ncbi:MBL fold metallo-hydrolase [bacterium]|nr:MBL fold metallo-hydrolase [bacterium]